MRNKLMSAGKVELYEEPYNHPYIGGKIYAVNTETGEEMSKIWHRKHNSNDRLDIMTYLMISMGALENAGLD